MKEKDISIEIERTAEFITVANELGDYIQSLPINKQVNDTLIGLIVKQVNVAEKEAFRQGFVIGARLVDGSDPQDRKKVATKHYIKPLRKGQ